MFCIVVQVNADLQIEALFGYRLFDSVEKASVPYTKATRYAPYTYTLFLA